MMNRIAPRQPLPVHSEEMWWLNELLIDLKLTASGDLDAVTPIDGERLAHWTLIHRNKIACCHHDVLGRLRQGEPHKEALAFFDALIDDVKAGKKIDGWRLHDAHLHTRNLESCREDWIKY